MSKAFIIIFFLFIVLLFPQSEVFAQAACKQDAAGKWGCADITNPGTWCPTEQTTTCRCLANIATAPGICPGGVGTGGAGTGAAAPPAAPAIDCSKPENSDKCTGGKGIPCRTSDGGTFTDPTQKGDGIMTAIGCIPTQPQRLVESLLKYGTFASGGIAFLLMILGALQMITAEGNPEAIKHAQERFYSAIIGLLLIVFAVLLMQFIGVDILGLKDFKP